MKSKAKKSLKKVKRKSAISAILSTKDNIKKALDYLHNRFGVERYKIGNSPYGAANTLHLVHSTILWFPQQNMLSRVSDPTGPFYWGQFLMLIRSPIIGFRLMDAYGRWIDTWEAFGRENWFEHTSQEILDLMAQKGGRVVEVSYANSFTHFLKNLDRKVVAAIKKRSGPETKKSKHTMNGKPLKTFGTSLKNHPKKKPSNIKLSNTKLSNIKSKVKKEPADTHKVNTDLIKNYLATKLRNTKSIVDGDILWFPGKSVCGDFFDSHYAVPNEYYKEFVMVVTGDKKKNSDELFEDGFRLKNVHDHFITLDEWDDLTYTQGEILEGIKKHGGWKASGARKGTLRDFLDDLNKQIRCGAPDKTVDKGNHRGAEIMKGDDAIEALRDIPGRFVSLGKKMKDLEEEKKRVLSIAKKKIQRGTVIRFPGQDLVGTPESGVFTKNQRELAVVKFVYEGGVVLVNAAGEYLTPRNIGRDYVDRGVCSSLGDLLEGMHASGAYIRSVMDEGAILKGLN